MKSRLITSLILVVYMTAWVIEVRGLSVLAPESSKTVKLAGVEKLTPTSDEKTIDLDELNPKENNCRIDEKSPSSGIKCSKIPLFCRSVCDQSKRLNFDANLRRISPFSFGAYKVTTSLEVNFGSGLRRIDTDAFNGMVVDEDAILYINIGDSDTNVCIFI